MHVIYLGPKIWKKSTESAFSLIALSDSSITTLASLNLYFKTVAAK